MTGIFAKRPVPGSVKTRLVPPLTPDQAARLALGMLDDVVAGALEPEARSRARLCFAPAAEEAWFRARYGARVDLRPQRGLDLGARLAAFFEDAFAEGETETVVAVGSDAPLIPARRLDEAHAALEAGADLVLGPDGGGGYYLVGLRAPAPELFLEVAMSTPANRAETEALARARGLAVALVAPGDDVDVEADLERLRSLLVSPGDARVPPGTLAALAAIFSPA